MHETQFWRAVPLLALAYVLQTTWLAHVTFFGVHLDLPLLVAVSVSLAGGAHRGAWTGFGAGLLDGTGAAFHLGSFLVSRTAAAGLVGFSPRVLSPDNPFTPPICAAAAAVTADFVMLIMDPTGQSFLWWVRHAALSAGVQALFAWPVYAVVRWAVVPAPKPMFGR